jgi:hypothetical protein
LLIVFSQLKLRESFPEGSMAEDINAEGTENVVPQNPAQLCENGGSGRGDGSRRGRVAECDDDAGGSAGERDL